MIHITFIVRVHMPWRGTPFCICAFEAGKLPFDRRVAFAPTKEKRVHFTMINFLRILLQHNVCITTVFLKRCPRHCACALAARCH